MKKKKVWMKTSLGLIGAAMALGFSVNGLQEPLEVEAAAAPFYQLSATKQTDNAYATAHTVTVNGMQWSAQGNLSVEGCWGIGGKSLKTPTDRTIKSLEPMAAEIGKIDMHVGASTITLNSLTLEVANDVNFATIIDTVPVQFVANSVLTFNPTKVTSWASGSYYRFLFNVTNDTKSNKKVEFRGADFYEKEYAVENIAITKAPSKTSYSVGEEFDPTGMEVTATYAGAVTEVVTDRCVFTPSPIVAGTTSVLVSYTEGGVTKTVEQPISIATITGVKVIGDMAKKSYFIGETWDVAGLSLEITYDNGKIDTMPLADTNPTFSAPAVAEGATSVTISGEYFGHSYTITVNGIQTKAPDYTLIKDCANLYSGMKFIIGAPDAAEVDNVTGKTMIPAAGAFYKDRYEIEKVETIATGAPVKSTALSVFTLEGTADHWALKTSDGQYLKTNTSGDCSIVSTNASTYCISLHAASNRLVIQDAQSKRYIAYNNSSPRFKAYQKVGTEYPAGTIYALLETDNVLAFIGETMRMGDTGMMGEGTGACISSSYYANAKNALSKLTSAERLSFQNDEGGKYTAALARYVAWASAAGDRAPFDGNAAVSASAYGFNLMDDKQDRSVILVTSIGFVGAMVAGCYLYYRKKKAAR